MVINACFIKLQSSLFAASRILATSLLDPFCRSRRAFALIPQRILPIFYHAFAFQRPYSVKVLSHTTTIRRPRRIKVSTLVSFVIRFQTPNVIVFRSGNLEPPIITFGVTLV